MTTHVSGCYEEFMYYVASKGSAAVELQLSDVRYFTEIIYRTWYDRAATVQIMSSTL